MLDESGVVDISEVIGQNLIRHPVYQEFIRVSALSVGLYRLPVGAMDPQRPHNQDEVYYVVSGRARLSLGLEEFQIKAGSVAYVAAGHPHQFHTIEEELIIVVFFAPAEEGNSG